MIHEVAEDIWGTFYTHPPSSQDSILRIATDLSSNLRVSHL
jgi:hypothetical protein